jgi:MSHA biogenesis protein MshP
MRDRQQGLSLVAALFLIVVLSAIGTFAVRIGAAQQQGTTAALLEHRAMAAAYAGIEIGANRVRASASCPTGDIPLQQWLTGFTITVDCKLTTPRRITATARYGTYGAPEYVTRTVVKTVDNAP